MERSRISHFLVGGLLAFVFTACSEKRESIQVSNADITESMYSSVTLEPEFLYSVYSELPGKIVQFKKETGDSIAFGDVICTIDAVVAINNSENAALNLELIQNKLFGSASVIEDLDQEINFARQQYSVDSLQFTRNEKLNASNIATASELEQSELRARSSKTRLEGLIAQKNRLKRELKIQQKQAKNAYESALSTSSAATITSVVDGMVYEVFKENGEFVNSQQPIAMIGSSSEYIIRMLIDEVDIIQVDIGQEVKVSLEAYPGETFVAHVKQIYPKMDPKTQSFEVIAKFKTPPPKLYLGLTGEANIIIREETNVIVIPRSYLIDDTYVETKNGRKKIVTGLKSLSSVQVLEGLSVGETIYLPAE
jgi:multidrug efflux pump subunit AcrA (membrane-fusion protein)